MKQSITLTAVFGVKFQPENKSVFWSTSNKKIATVSGGTVTGVKAGYVTIRACAVADPTVCASRTITVIPQGKKVNIDDLDNGTKTIDLGTKGTAGEKITYQLSASVFPADAEQGITWSSQNPSIATVDQNGLVTATGTGKVNITATTTDGLRKSKSFKLNVVSTIQDGSIVLSGENLVIQKKKVTLNVAYDQAVQPVKAKLVWSSSDPSIAKVSNKGVVTGAYGGTAVIKACSASNQSYCGSFTMTVEGIASSVVISDNDNGTKLIDIGTAGTANEKITYKLSANVLPANVKQEMTWSSSNPAVASVDGNGLVTGHSSGSAAITVTSNDDAHKKAKVTIKVTSNVQPGSLTLSGPDTFGIKEAKSLTAVFNQLNQPVKNKIKWASSDPKIAKVSNGTVTGVSDGTAVITACAAADTAVCASRNVTVGTAALPREPFFLMMAASPAEIDETGSGLMSFDSEPETLPETGSAGETFDIPEVTSDTPEPTAEPAKPEETAVPETKNSLQFAREKMDLQVGESLALDIVNPDAASFMVMVKGDEKSLSFDEKTNTVTGLAAGDTVAYLADIKTVDIVDTMQIHVLAAKPVTQATPIPAENASAEPTKEPVAKLTEEPTAAPTEVLTAGPIVETVVAPTDEPTAEPIEELSAMPTEEPVVEPTEEPIAEPAEEPTAEPMEEPAAEQTDELTAEPTDEATDEPSEEPAEEPSDELTAEPTDEAADEPSEEPAEEPSDELSVEPADEPADELTAEPTDEVTDEPSEEPADEQTDELTVEPTDEATDEPSDEPAEEQTDVFSAEPTDGYIDEPSDEPAEEPSDELTAEPTDGYTDEPSDEPADEPADDYTAEPTDGYTDEPSDEPADEPADEFSAEPTDGYTDEPSDEFSAEPTEEPIAEPTEEFTYEPTEEPYVEPTEEPTPVPLIDPYFDSDEYELRVGETMQIWYHNPDNQTVYLVLAEGAENVGWDESSFTITAAEPGDLTILLTSVEPYAVKARCVVHILEAEKVPVDIFREEEAKMVTNELIRLDDLLIEENAEDYEVVIDDYETYCEYIFWNEEQDTLTAYKPGDVKLILRRPGSDEDLDSIIIHIEPAPEPEYDPAPAEEPVPDPADQPDPEIPEPDPVEPDITEPDPAETEETPSDPDRTEGGIPEDPAEESDPEDPPADPVTE